MVEMFRVDPTYRLPHEFLPIRFFYIPRHPAVPVQETEEPESGKSCTN